MVGNDITSNIGWIKSATTEHEILTLHTSWLYSDTLGDPTLSDPTLRLREDFEPDVAGILSDIHQLDIHGLGLDSLESKKYKIIDRFLELPSWKKETVLLHVDSGLEFLHFIPENQRDKE